MHCALGAAMKKRFAGQVHLQFLGLDGGGMQIHLQDDRLLTGYRHYWRTDRNNAGSFMDEQFSICN